jgi:hypothetical protein
MGNVSNLAALMLFGALVGGAPAGAQMAVDGAYERLSPGHQRLARALFEAQTAPGPTARRGARTLTRDEIAARKLRGEGWGRIFNDMQARGLVRERSLPDLLARHERTHAPGAVASAAESPPAPAGHRAR